MALGFALFFHSVAAGFVQPLNPQPTPEREIIANAVVLKVEKRASPTPSPTPKPVATPIPHTRVIADKSVTPHKIDPGASAHKEAIVKAGSSRPKTKTKYHSKPIWDIPVGGQGAGAGKTGTVGSLGHGGTGTGQGSHGAGAGGGGTQPCGAVDFEPPTSPTTDPQTGLIVYYDIEIVVHYPDGTNQSVKLDYPWHYRNPNFDPFKHSDLPALFQFPPSAMRANEPPLVRYVMAHTTREGFTEFNDCPGLPPPPTPH
jgi:hypothetical protein